MKTKKEYKETLEWIVQFLFKKNVPREFPSENVFKMEMVQMLQ